ncbi:FAD/NAD(P)-binding domain-containing protein [Dothidotthia symphoricarpi CBS 119687]|uniref:FAD/NAD(P)-binding domain-containing protein n=1 Tax=Dothidotthia symphoricarpi CBS 119687 TaxID=1392245 RepID=A0A6A6A1V8_9PLEO|nr:FAD/NAD(P)-binding domain-containing protein [Dothidotthia symphoricarpi CBS 119687]KAF2125185.1 FAD/NAD(P)-binding domain-containing protein [Dothidotthia symphoricarpi CBS 119687]
MSTSPNLSVLICGSGIAGPTLAFWLHRFLPSSRITILERSPVPRHGGQAVDLRSASVPIVQRMGIMDAIRAKTTTEQGVEFVYADGIRKASFGASGNVEQQSMTSEFEILRGDLAEILMVVTQDIPEIEYVFDEMMISASEEPSGKITVKFQNRLPTAQYDLVVGADGMMSRTRRSVFGHGPDDNDYLRRLGQYAALCTIPRTADDTDFAQWYNAAEGRLILLRPDQYGTTRAYIAVTDANLSRFDEIDKLMREGGKQEQMKWFEEQFRGAGWQTDRVLEGMRKSEDYYMQEIAQVKMDSWVKGRVVLVGDAAFAPSPISGVGTGSAIVGAYVLAGELSKSPEDIPRALKQYEEIVRPYVDKVQRLVPGAPQVANPQTAWGVWAFNTAAGVASLPIVKRFGGLLGSLLPAFGGTNWPLPDYHVG